MTKRYRQSEKHQELLWVFVVSWALILLFFGTQAGLVSLEAWVVAALLSGFLALLPTRAWEFLRNGR